jgi:protoporphyrinogen oxidase
MAGCGAAYRLSAEGIKPVMYDQNSYHGGHTASHKHAGGWTFDEGPHVSFTTDKRIQELFAGNVEGRFETLNTYVDNYWRGHWLKHPAPCNLYGLPAEVLIPLLKDFIEAQHKEHGTIENYEQWLRASYGNTFAELFPMQYTRKYHTTDASNMSLEWIGPRLYKANIEEVLRGVLQPSTPNVHYVTHFRYPSHGGFQSYLNAFMKLADLRLNRRITRIDPRARQLHFSDGVVAGYGKLISSMALPDLIPMIDGVPADVRAAAARLACTQVVLVNLGINRPDLHKAFWTYFYDQDIFFTRLSTPHLQSPNNVPEGCGSLQVECYYSKKYRPLDRKPEECIEPVIADLRKVGILKDSDKILFRNAVLIPYANVIFDLELSAARATVHGYLDDIGIGYCGRYGDWAYTWTDEAFKSGENAATKILETHRAAA